MYCNQCGNILTEQGAFCSFCGAKNDEAIATATVAKAPQTTTVVNETSVPANEPVAPQPDQNAQASVPIYTSPATPTGYTSEVPMNMPPVAQPQKPEKYYTFNHILMCLAAVAVMAIVAGVFAGLYFSTI